MLSLKYAAVLFVAGGLGTTARYFMGLLSLHLFGPRFALATLLVNAVGCFIFGLTWEALGRYMFSEAVRIVALAGFLGSFTTFSSFIFESYVFGSQHTGWLLLNLAGQLGLGFLCLYLGFMLGRLL